MALDLHLTAPQSDLFLCPVRFPLFIGGFGSGKSETLVSRVMDDIYDPRLGSEVKIGVYAPTFDLLKLVLVPRFEEFLTRMYPGRRGRRRWEYHKQDRMLHVYGHGKIIFRSLDNPARIVGYEVYRSYIDELDTLNMAKAEEAWNKIIARTRQKCNGFADNRVSAFTTPEGFRFTYNRWGKSTSENYAYVRAPTYSNPHLPDTFIESLRETYSAALLQAYLEGIWCNLTQGAVYPEFDRHQHKSNEDVKSGETLHIGMDFNVYKMMSVVHVYRVEKGQDQRIPHAVDEFTNLRDTPAMIKAIKERYPEHPINVYPDSSGDHGDTRASKTDLELLRQANFIVDAPKANPRVKNRINSVNGMLLNSLGMVRYRVNTEKCPHYTEALEQQVYDDNGMPDKEAGLDHITDAAGYFVHRRHPIEVEMTGFAHYTWG